MKVLVLPFGCALLLCAPIASAQTTLFQESFGTPSSTTAIGSYTGYDNVGVVTFSGTADIRNTTVSNSYVDASGGGNVFLSSTGSKTFQISGIDTSGFDGGSLNLTFGAAKESKDTDMSDLVFGYSTDGSNFTTIALPLQPTGTGTTGWRAMTLTLTSIPQGADVSLRWTNMGTNSSGYRLDDISLSAIPEPSTYAAFAGLASLAGAIWWRRKRGSTSPN